MENMLKFHELLPKFFPQLTLHTRNNLITNCCANVAKSSRRSSSNSNMPCDPIPCHAMPCHSGTRNEVVWDWL